METMPRGWTVIDRAAGVLTHTYEFTNNATATTFVARMGDGKLMVVSPCTGLDPELATELETFGTVGAIVANNGYHHMGLAEWQQRFPEADVYAPERAIDRIAKKSPAAGALRPLEQLDTGADVGVREAADSKCGESWYWARTEEGYAWYTSDVLINLPHLPPNPLAKLLFWATKSAPGFRVFSLGLSMLVRDKKATLRSFLDDVEAHPPSVLIPAHGERLDHGSIAEDTRAIIKAKL